MENSIITFIGGGNMAASLIGGLIADGHEPSALRVADTDPARLQALAGLGVATFEDNLDAAQGAEAVILAVKPQVLQPVARQLAPLATGQGPLFLSVAAGIRMADIERWLGGGAVVRAMPNTPALIQAGATALVANAEVSEGQHELAESIMRAVGLVVWLDDEAQIDLVTALSGSGPAYFFLFMEALEEAAVELGLPADTARLLALQTGFGATKMALESDEPPAELRRRVTSPGGTTERAVAELEQGGLRQLARRALEAAAARSRELADQFGKDV